MKSKIFLIGLISVLVISGCGTQVTGLSGTAVLSSLCNDANQLTIQPTADSPSGDAIVSDHRIIAKFSITPNDCELSISNLQFNTVSHGVIMTNMQVYPEEFDEKTTYSSVTPYSYNANSSTNGCFKKDQVDVSHPEEQNRLFIEQNTTKNIVVRGDISTVKVKDPAVGATQQLELTKINDMFFTQPVSGTVLVYRSNKGTPPNGCPSGVTAFGTTPNF